MTNAPGNLVGVKMMEVGLLLAISSALSVYPRTDGLDRGSGRPVEGTVQLAGPQQALNSVDANVSVTF
jgi:hypothetical protein